MTSQAPFKPLKKNRLYEEVADQIKQAIYDGTYKPGDRLPSERDLSVMFNVGRPTIREALRTLSVVGLVQIHRGAKGAIVSEADISQYMESMREQLSCLIRTDKKTMKELWEARKYIELGIAHAVARNAKKTDFKKLAALLTTLDENTDDVETYLKLSTEFHKELALATKNKVFLLFWELCHDILIKGYAPIMKEKHPTGILKTLKANKIMLEAIKTKKTAIIDKTMADHSNAELYFFDNM